MSKQQDQIEGKKNIQLDFKYLVDNNINPSKTFK